ncbi:MAG: thermonuclease family protein [Alphaproteobacteria bacterium]|nr:thermonuclease family protein [Alphaproteobacteria bacterium]
MFGWRKKRDGFEWRSYVRTTILVKRKQRQDKLEEARQAALDGLVEAGRAGKAAGQSGVEAAKRGLDAAAREAQAAGGKVAAGARIAGQKVGQNLGRGVAAAGRAAHTGAVRAGSGLWRISRVAGSKLGKAGGEGIDRIAGGLSGVGQAMSPRVALPLVIAGLAAVFGAVARAFQHGFDAVAISASVIAAVLIGLAVLPVIAGRASLSAPFSTRRYSGDGKSSGDLPAADKNADFAGLAKGLVGLVVLSLFAGLIWLAAPYLSRSDLPGSPPLAPTADAATIEGKARALSGDVMLVGGEKVLLRGIEAPAVRQTCTDERGRSWRCGRSALNALRKITGYETVVCSVAEIDGEGRKVADCRVGDTNIAASLVKDGAVFAGTGFFRAYGSEEAEAKAARRGLWQGTAQRPSETVSR